MGFIGCSMVLHGLFEVWKLETLWLFTCYDSHVIQFEATEMESHIHLSQYPHLSPIPCRQCEIQQPPSPQTPNPWKMKINPIHFDTEEGPCRPGHPGHPGDPGDPRCAPRARTPQHEASHLRLLPSCPRHRSSLVVMKISLIWLGLIQQLYSLYLSSKFYMLLG